MNVLVSSTILSLSIIFLASSIYELRPHNKRKKRKPASKPQPITRVHSSVIDLRMTDLRNAKD